jgi:hypothetical protein
MTFVSILDKLLKTPTFGPETTEIHPVQGNVVHTCVVDNVFNLV